MTSQGAPDRVNPQSLNDYLDVMSRAVFQSGISWKVVQNKWPGIRAAFHDFDVPKVADFGPPDIDALLKDDRVIRNHRKLDGVVANAQRMLELEKEHGSFKRYLTAHGDFEATVRALRKDFTFLGEMGSYYFLYVVGEPVPPHHEWMASRERLRG